MRRDLPRIHRGPSETGRECHARRHREGGSALIGSWPGLTCWACLELLGFFLCVFGFLLSGGGANARDACEIWRENRLLAGSKLADHRFYLEPSGPLRQMHPAPSAPNRPIFHRTFSLSAGASENLSLFQGSPPESVLVTLDPEEKQSLKLPVFFIGGEGEDEEQLKEKALASRFAPSQKLGAGMDFANVAFHLARSSFYFGEIQPFFRCGLPGLLLCARRCPPNGVLLASSLVNAVVNGQFLASEPKTAEAKQDNEGGSRQEAVPSAPKPEQSAPGEGKPKNESRPEVAPPPPPEAQKPAPQAEPSKPPASEEPGKSPAAPPPEPKQLVLTFETANHIPLEAAEVLLVEKEVKIEGVPFELKPEGLVAKLAPDAFERSNHPLLIKELFHHYRVDIVKPAANGYLLTVDPLYVHADAVTVEVRDAAGQPVTKCSIHMEVPEDRQLGQGWDALRQGQQGRELKFFNEGAVYRVNLPAEIPAGKLLISTSETGGTLTLSSGGGCLFGEAGTVSLRELRGLALKRSLKKSGPIFIAIVTADSDFASALPIDVEVFWINALDLIQSVSSADWKTKILARAQAPGMTPATTILDATSGSARLDAEEENRARHLSELRLASQLKPGPLAIIKSRPIERFHLDLALKTLFAMANMPERPAIGEEALLIVSGSVKKDGSHFCTSSVQGENADAARPRWIKDIRRAFAIEVWDDGAIENLKKAAQAEPAGDAPAGLYRCKIGGEDGDKINLYGMSATLLKEAKARQAIFASLTEKAKAFLKP